MLSDARSRSWSGADFAVAFMTRPAALGGHPPRVGGRPAPGSVEFHAGPLERFREVEARQVRPWLTPGCRLLDIGAGSGYQSRLFHEYGCDVTAIDVEVDHDASLFWPVQRFDGIRLPFGDRSFDVVFTSNVMEHVREPTRLLREIGRVVKPDGRVIHIVPSASWRVWTSVARGVHGTRTILGIGQGSPSSRPHPGSSDGGRPRAVDARKRSVSDLLFGPPHGEFASTLCEVRAYRRRAWLDRLTAEGLRSVFTAGNGLFYTGYTLCPRLSIAWRRRLASVLGSSCHVFVLQPAPRVPNG